MSALVSDCPAAEIELGRLLRAGDRLFVPQGASEPIGLSKALVEQVDQLADLTVFIGLSLTGLFDRAFASRCRIESYGAMGSFAGLDAEGLIDVVPCNYSDLPRLVRSGKIACDVVFVQVGPVDADGNHSLGLCTDYTVEAIDGARLVIAEVNDQLPTPESALRIAADRVDVAVPVSRPLLEVSRQRPSDVDRAIARGVADHIPDGATIQLGFGATVDAIGGLLGGRRGLRVHTALVGDWLLDLEAAGALAEDDEVPVVTTGAALGSQALYEFVATSPRVQFKRIEDIQGAAALAGQPGLVAVNSALQVDLAGQTNTEVLGESRVSALGGHTDFTRGAQTAPGGVSIVALPATSRDGRTGRIVSRLDSGWVSTQQSAVDIVVTDQGSADLRGSHVRQRETALLSIAAPQFRQELNCHRGRPAPHHEVGVQEREPS